MQWRPPKTIDGDHLQTEISTRTLALRVFMRTSFWHQLPLRLLARRVCAAHLED
jgi:hypothetical protein